MQTQVSWTGSDNQTARALLGKTGKLASPFAELRKKIIMWLWLKIKEPGLRRFYSLVPFTKGPFWYIYLSHSHVASGLVCSLEIKVGCLPQATRPRVPLTEGPDRVEGELQIRFRSISHATWNTRIAMSTPYFLNPSSLIGGVPGSNVGNHHCWMDTCPLLIE